MRQKSKCMKMMKKLGMKLLLMSAGILAVNLKSVDTEAAGKSETRQETLKQGGLDSHQDDPVSGILDKDDFESVKEWEKYLKNYLEMQQETWKNGSVSSRMASGNWLSGPSSVIPGMHVKAEAVLQYTLKELPIHTAIQKCYVAGETIYVTQRKNSDTYLSRCVLEDGGQTAVCQDRMILKNFGHGQTLEGYEYNGNMYFWVSCKANTAYTERWSMQIGRIQYEPQKTITNYTKICRLANLNYANEDMKSFGSVKRVDASLSDDGTKLVLWVQNIYSEIQYSVYDASVLNSLLDAKEGYSSKYVSFENNVALKAACIESFEQNSADERILPNDSFQGIGCADDMSVYVCGGKSGEVPGIVVMSKKRSGYDYTSMVTISSRDFNSQTEVEGLQLEGNFVYLGICNHDIKSEEQYIYSIGRDSVSAGAEGHRSIGKRNVKKASCTAAGYTGDVYCKECNEKLGTGRLILATGHTWNQGIVTKKPTAVQTGVKTYTCLACKDIKTEKIAATGVPAKGKVLISGKVSYKVTAAGPKNAAVQYMKNKGKVTSVKIPASVKINGITYRVTSVASGAFKNNKKITKVSIGSNVTSIGKAAFSGCTKLKTVSLGSKVSTIGVRSFFKCTKLTKISLPAQVNKIGTQAFYGCKKLKSITIKTTKLTNKKVGSKAFRGIHSNAVMKVPKSKIIAYKKWLKKKGISSKTKIR